MKNIKNKILNNINVICITLFLISLILSSFNLFSGLHNIVITIIVFIILGVGCGLEIYDWRKNK